MTFLYALATGCLFTYLFYGAIPGISFPLFFCFCIALTFLLYRRKLKSLNPTQIIIISGILIFSFFFAFRSALELQIVNFCLTLYLFTLFISSCSKEKQMKEGGLYDYLPDINHCFIKSAQIGKQEVTALCQSQTEGKDKKLKSILKGILYALPLLFVFSMLMANADLLFERFFNSFWQFSKQYLLEGIGRTALLIFTTILFTGIYLIIDRKNQSNLEPFKEARSKKIGFIEGIVALTLTNLLFSIFTVIQIIFLVGGEQQISSLNISYSVYAREGFWQMIWIGITAFILSLVSGKIMMRETKKQHYIYKANVFLMSVMMLVIMVSAFYRLWLYEQSYGFTILRFYSHTFIVYLAILFIILSIKIIQEQNNNKFVFKIFVTSLLTFMLWNISNPHSFIATMNLKRHQESARKLDVSYLKRLSDDAIPVIVSGLREEGDQSTMYQLQILLKSRRNKIRRKIDKSKWLSYNIATLKARQTIEDHLSIKRYRHGMVWEIKKDGIAKKTRKELERKSGKKIVSKENFLPPQKKKQIKKK